jgi:superfamily I DNA/RNA helicase
MISFSPSLTPPPPPRPTLSTNLTEEQSACVEWAVNGNGNLIIEAVAGSGKTFTIIEMCVALVQKLSDSNRAPYKAIALMSFNAKVRDELKLRIQNRGLAQWVEVNTVHGFGFSAFKTAYGPRKPNSFKLGDIIDPILKSFKLNWSFTKPIQQAVSIAKDTGMDLFFPNNTTEWKKLIDKHDITWDEDKLPLSSFINICSDAFHLSSKDKAKIDFSDMIWFPLKENLPFPQFDFVFIDEAQDTNATRREVAKRMLDKADQEDHKGRPGGRLISVGDRHQAIYGFTGADNDALDILKKEFSAHELPLSTCFRCSKAVIAHARTIVNHINANVGAITGSVNLSVPEYNFHENLFAQSYPDISRSAILCRKNAPLISLAFQLLERQIPCRIEGRDIGQELIKLCKKFNQISKLALSQGLFQHLLSQAQKLSPYKFDLLSDKVSAIQSILQLPSIQSVPQLYQQIESVFSDYDPSKPSKLTLSSVHKSKGLEWTTVYLLGRNAWMPSKFATQPWMEEQEQNLIYVAITRAKDSLYEIQIEE